MNAAVGRQAPEHGYLLVELALVLLVLAILARATLATSATGFERLREARVVAQLDDARERLVAYLVAHGSLPCPIDAASGAIDRERPAGQSDCRASQGDLPADRLALPGRGDPTGRVFDPWGRALHYAIAASHPSGPEVGGTVSAPLDRGGESSGVGDGSALRICRSLSGEHCESNRRFVTGLAAVVWSDGPGLHESRAERENRDGDAVFVHQAPTTVSGRAFDDRLVWLSRLEIDYWRLRAGWWSPD